MKTLTKNNMASVFSKSRETALQQIEISTKRSAVGLRQVFQTGRIKLNTLRVPFSDIFFKRSMSLHAPQWHYRGCT